MGRKREKSGKNKESNMNLKKKWKGTLRERK